MTGMLTSSAHHKATIPAFIVWVRRGHPGEKRNVSLHTPTVAEC